MPLNTDKPEAKAAGKAKVVKFTAKVTKKGIPLTDKKHGISLSIDKDKKYSLPGEYEGRLKVLEADDLITIKTS